MRKTLTCILAGAAALPGAATEEMLTAAERARSGSFDVTGEVACAQEVGQTMGICDAAVARVGASAAVVVTFQNGFARTLMFDNGVFLRGNPTMSGVGTDTDWRVSGGMFFVRVDDQRFELSQALVFGE